MANNGRKGRKIGRQARKPAHQRYTAAERWMSYKRRNVRKSSHGRWSYETLIEHQRHLAKQPVKRLSKEERNCRAEVALRRKTRKRASLHLGLWGVNWDRQVCEA